MCRYDRKDFIECSLSQKNAMAYKCRLFEYLLIYTFISTGSLCSGCTDEQTSSRELIDQDSGRIDLLPDRKWYIDGLELDSTSSIGDLNALPQDMFTRPDIDLSDEHNINHGESNEPENCPNLSRLEHRLSLEALNGEPQQIELSPCVSPQLQFSLPRGSRWSISLSVRLSDEQVEDVDAESIDAQQISMTRARIYNAQQWATHTRVNEPNESFSAEASLSPITHHEWRADLDINPTQTGRHTLILVHNDLSPPTAILQSLTLTLTLTCIGECHLEGSQYPLVLVHGYAGVDQYFGVLDYFYRVPQELRALGYEVLVPSLSPIELTSIRAEQLLNTLEQAQREKGYEKFNLIAHSQGGLDSRYLISTLNAASMIASLTTIATPHQGIPLRIVDFFSEQDFSEDHLRRFNDENPDHPAVRYFSWSARTCSAIEWRCLREHDGELVTPFLLPTYTLLSSRGSNDGLVPTSSMIHGEHLGLLSADHFDQIGQIADRPRQSFNHQSFYRLEARRLRRLGL